jgi:hypothetical protein
VADLVSIRCAIALASCGLYIKQKANSIKMKQCFEKTDEIVYLRFIVSDRK